MPKWFHKEKKEEAAPKAAPPDMDDILFNMKFNAKQLQRMAKKAEADAKKEKRLCKENIEKNNPEGARVHAENAIRKSNQALQYQKLESRLDAVHSKLQGHQMMMGATSQIGEITQLLDVALKQSDVEQISKVMDKFAGQFEDLDVQATYLDTAVGETTALTTPQGDVEKLMQQIGDEHNLSVAGMISGTPLPVGNAGSTKVGTQDDLEARFKNLAK